MIFKCTGMQLQLVWSSHIFSEDGRGRGVYGPRRTSWIKADVLEKKADQTIIHRFHRCTFCTATLNSNTQGGWAFSSRLSEALKASVFIRQTQPFAARSLTTTPLVFFVWFLLIIFRKRTTLSQEEQKALQHYSIFLHWSYQKRWDGLKQSPFPSTCACEECGQRSVAEWRLVCPFVCRSPP